jgi:hypothetical protein
VELAALGGAIGSSCMESPKSLAAAWHAGCEVPAELCDCWFVRSLTAAAHAAGPQVRSCSYTSGEQVLRAHATQRLPIAKLEFTAAQQVAAGRCDRYIGSDHTAPLSLWLKASGSWARAELRVAELLAKRSLVSHGAQDRAIRLL